MNIPLIFEDIVREIRDHTMLADDEVRRRVWLEAVEPGWNVQRDISKFGVRPHCYDVKMEALYRMSDGFIFETLVYWASPERQQWTTAACDRIDAYCARQGVQRDSVRVLLIGDGAGNDSLQCVQRGYSVVYFDVPDSRTFDFAARRFRARGVEGDRIRIVTDLSLLPRVAFDVVV
jgi:hypothetical protein